MEDRVKVLSWLEGLTFDDWRMYHSDSEVQNIAKAAFELLKEQDPVEPRVRMTEEEFLTHIISEICDFAVFNDMEPDETLSIVADNIKAILEVSTFNGWKREVK